MPWFITLCHGSLYCAMVHYIVPQFIILCHSKFFLFLIDVVPILQYVCGVLLCLVALNSDFQTIFFIFSISGVCPSEFSFTLRIVREDGCWCERCPWYRFCRGCALDVNDDLFRSASSTIAIDWEPTFYHLRYQESLEFVRWSVPLLVSGHYQNFPPCLQMMQEHESIRKARQEHTEPISLDSCLKMFTHEEELGPDALYNCGKCEKMQLASKRMQLWKLPPALVNLNFFRKFIHIFSFLYMLDGLGD